jgi:hypothetical protein
MSTLFFAFCREADAGKYMQMNRKTNKKRQRGIHPKETIE